MKRDGHCEVCGYTSVLDLHHDGENREEHILCPNCHALITRGILTLKELLDGLVKIRHKRDFIKYQSRRRAGQRATQKVTT